MPKNQIAGKGLSYLLDKEDLKKQPEELRRICEKIFCKGKRDSLPAGFSCWLFFRA